MIKVVLIGSGNIANHLIEAFAHTKKVAVIQLLARQKESLTAHFETSKIITSYANLAPADAYIIAVSDTAIAEVSAQLPFTNRLVVHTSGTTTLGALDSKNRKGVFYPLQTFSKNKSVNFGSVPICLESENSSDFEILKTIALSISDNVFKIDSDQRKKVHVAAVFVNNFVNHLYQIGENICQESNIPFEILHPLILETAHKVIGLSPIEAQTGPAKRNDISTIVAHLDILTNEKYSQIYKLLTQSIQENGKKL